MINHIQMPEKLMQLENGYLWVPIPKCATTSIKEHASTKITNPNAPKVAVIRHPCDRLVSVFHNVKYLKEDGGDDFDGFVRWACNQEEDRDAHLRSQYLYLPKKCSKCIKLIRLENINEYFASIGIMLKKLNSSVHKHWREYFTDYLFDMAINKYSKDMRMYNDATCW